MGDSPAGSKNTAYGLWIGIALLFLGLLGHLLTAYHAGNRSIDYQHHVLGFAFLAVVSAAVVGPLGLWLWRGRGDVTLLIVGALQSLFGLLVYLSMAGG